jgi:hypothetical protein
VCSQHDDPSQHDRPRTEAGRRLLKWLWTESEERAIRKAILAIEADAAAGRRDEGLQEALAGVGTLMRNPSWLLNDATVANWPGGGGRVSHDPIEPNRWQTDPDGAWVVLYLPAARTVHLNDDPGMVHDDAAALAATPASSPPLSTRTAPEAGPRYSHSLMDPDHPNPCPECDPAPEADE